MSHPIKNYWHKHRHDGESLRAFVRRMIRAAESPLTADEIVQCMNWANSKRLDLVSLNPGRRS